MKKLNKCILVTGGTGYIGSHTLIQLIKNGYEPVVFDNLANSSRQSLVRVELLAGIKIHFIEGDIRDKVKLQSLFKLYNFQAVVHFAGLKAVGESVEQPIKYYENNVYGSLQLFSVMAQYGVKTIIFSSSATVYGSPIGLPLKESMPTGMPTNPYGMSKLMIENILHDLYRADDSWNIVNLRYFNPVGAHESGEIGENPTDIPNNLMPFISQTAIGKREKILVFGGDYDTHDGTGVRDYIHVVDLAEGHLKAIEKVSKEPGFYNINLGTGVGYSVLDMIKAFSNVSGVEIPYEIVARRPGDIAACFSEATYARECLGWEAKRGIKEMCEDTWRWQSMNPNGFE
jgi:UDP-glucose 4-epimerase